MSCSDSHGSGHIYLAVLFPPIVFSFAVSVFICEHCFPASWIHTNIPHMLYPTSTHICHKLQFWSHCQSDNDFLATYYHTWIKLLVLFIASLCICFVFLWSTATCLSLICNAFNLHQSYYQSKPILQPSQQHKVCICWNKQVWYQTAIKTAKTLIM